MRKGTGMTVNQANVLDVEEGFATVNLWSMKIYVPMIQSNVSLFYASSHHRVAKESSKYCMFLLFSLYAPRYQCHALNIARSHAFLSIFHNTYSRLWILQVLTLSSLCSTIPIVGFEYYKFLHFRLYSPLYL